MFNFLEEVEARATKSLPLAVRIQKDNSYFNFDTCVSILSMRYKCNEHNANVLYKMMELSKELENI